MIARRDLMAKRLGLGSHKPLRGKHLFRGDHVVVAAGKQIDRKPQPREVDPLPQRDEAAAGEFVAFV